MKRFYIFLKNLFSRKIINTAETKSDIPDFRAKEGSGDICQLKPVTEEFVKKLHKDFERERPYFEKLAKETERAKNPCAYCHRRFDCNNSKDCKIIIGSAA